MSTSMRGAAWAGLLALVISNGAFAQPGGAATATTPAAGGQATRPRSAPLSEPRTIELWEGGAPGALGSDEADRPKMTMYPAGGPRGSRTAVVIAPGGAYAVLTMNSEGRQWAYWFNAQGITAFVLQYRLGPRYRHPVELGDAQRAIRLVRSRAAEWGFAIASA